MGFKGSNRRWGQTDQDREAAQYTAHVALIGVILAVGNIVQGTAQSNSLDSFIGFTGLFSTGSAFYYYQNEVKASAAYMPRRKKQRRALMHGFAATALALLGTYIATAPAYSREMPARSPASITQTAAKPIPHP